MKTGSYTGLRFIGCLLFLLCIISMSGCVGKAEQAQETGALSGEGVGSGEETGAGQQENEEKPDITEESVKESLSEAVSIDIAEEKKVDVDYSQAFQGINGCAAVYVPEDNSSYFYNKEMCIEQASPYSTFKIISALMGLHNGVIADETTAMEYNGTQYHNSAWNKDLSLREAFQTSCIWYFRQVIDAVGSAEVKKELEELRYGNCNITEWEGVDVNPIPELNGFWLDSSLRISPWEQVQVLARIFEGGSCYTEEETQILRSIMQNDTENGLILYGKTGTGPDGEGWFVGFVQNGEQNKYFAVYLNDSGNPETANGKKAKEIAEIIMRE